MKLYRISKCAYIDDLKGNGAAAFPGRWHSRGTYVLYTSATPSLALLESVVHMYHIAVSGYCMICLDVPEDSIQKITADQLPANWFASPSPDILKQTGDLFIKNNEYLALQLPSAIMPEEYNYLLNPAHSDFKKVKVVFTRSIGIDKRLL